MTVYTPWHELSEPLDCWVRRLGEGSIRLVMAGSVNANPAFLVRLYGSGQMRWVDQNDAVVYGNPGDPRDGRLITPIPDDWRVPT